MKTIFYTIGGELKMETDNKTLALSRKDEIILTKEQVPKFKEMISIVNAKERATLPKPPEPIKIYQSDGLIGIAIGITVLVIIIVMMLSRFI
jgi:hypothetical protein